MARDIVPHYRILGILGSGGMGSVWLAERSDGRFERQVAIKFINLAMMGPAGADRFKREGRILGKLAHPHIAEMIDAGVTANGEPYLVLEYVEGRSIDEYCDEHALDIEARIRLFLDVLSAVSHAHANLIVHRDIKPSNVLVRSDGQIKLLDFGIAKLLADETNAAAATVFTLEGAGMLTLRFAAPEQITHGGITTATDVYTLGVLLYLLLAGQHPAGNGPHSPAELVKAIVNDETTRPSDLVSSGDAGIAERRATTPDKLRRQLRGDLDTILGKALKKNPAERYTTVSAFADDLRHYLKHEPITARPDTTAYRAGKFVRRNRTVVALGGLAVLVTIAGIASTLVQARAARQQRDFALHQLSRAEAIADLNTVIFSDIYQSPETLDRAKRILEQDQTANLADRVEILITLGRNADMSKDGGAQARRLLEDGYQLSRGLSEPSTRAKAACALAGEVSYGADPARSEALVREGLNGLPERPEFALDRVFCLQRGSAVARAKGEPNEAISHLRLARQLLRLEPIHSWTLDLQVSLGLGDSLRLAGRNSEACAEFDEALGRLNTVGRGNSSFAASVYYRWGQALIQLGRPLEAEARIHRAIVIFSGSEGSPDAVPWQLISHAEALRDLGRLREAASEAEKGYAKSMNNGDAVRVIQALLLRASISRKLGDVVRAREILEELEPRLRRGLPTGDISFASLLSEQALLAQRRGDASIALDLTNRALAIAEGSVKAGQEGAHLVPIFLTDRSETERQLGRADEAVADATRALVSVNKAAQPGTFSVLAGHAYLALGRALQAQGKNDEARADFRLATEHLEKALGPDNADTRAARQLAALAVR